MPSHIAEGETCETHIVRISSPKEYNEYDRLGVDKSTDTNEF